MGEKSFKMLLGNQLFTNNRKGLGFGKASVYKQTTSYTVRGRSVFPKCVIVAILDIVIIVVKLGT